jgi:hypothetical protein
MGAKPISICIVAAVSESGRSENSGGGDQVLGAIGLAGMCRAPTSVRRLFATPQNQIFQAMKTRSLGRKILLGMNVATALNGLLADWNRTHLFNSKWPPHAKFHDGMTLSMGLILGGLGIAALNRKAGDPAENLCLAALGPAIFFTAMLSAQAYPGADSIETEFPDYWPKVGGLSFSEVPFAATMLLATAAGWKLAGADDEGSPTRVAPASDEIPTLAEDQPR